MWHLCKNERNQSASCEAKKYQGFIFPEGGHKLCQLLHNSDNPVAEDNLGGDCLQCLRPLPEDPQPAEANLTQEGEPPDPEEKTSYQYWGRHQQPSTAVLSDPWASDEPVSKLPKLLQPVSLLWPIKLWSLLLNLLSYCLTVNSVIFTYTVY